MQGNAPAIFRIFVPVRDIDKAKAFYEELFNDDGKEVHTGRIYFYCGPVIFAVIENNGAPLNDHVYFSVPNLESVFTRAKALDCLEKDDVHGSPSGEINVRPWGERSFYARDPFGNGLCFVDEKTLFTEPRERPV